MTNSWPALLCLRLASNRWVRCLILVRFRALKVLVGVGLSVSICGPSFCGVPGTIGTSRLWSADFQPIEHVESATEPVGESWTAKSLRLDGSVESKQKTNNWWHIDSILSIHRCFYNSLYICSSRSSSFPFWLPNVDYRYLLVWRVISSHTIAELTC